MVKTRARAGRLRLTTTRLFLTIVVIGSMLLLQVARCIDCKQFESIFNVEEDKSDTLLTGVAAAAAAAAAGSRRGQSESIQQLGTESKHDDAGNKELAGNFRRWRRAPFLEDLGGSAKKRYGNNKARGGEQSSSGLTYGSPNEQTSQQQQQQTGATSRTAGSSIKNVTAQNGQSVLLHCIVEPSGDLAVSWFRGSGEPQLLTYETNTVIDDDRFVVHHGLLKENDWALQIKSLDKSTDSGLYQCQTNSEPPESQFYQLNIIEPQVHILGAPDMAVKLGAQINLTCVISQSPDQLPFIFWYRNERMINYDMNERGKIVNSKWPHKQDTIVSNLQIYHSRLSDSANYTCMPSGARPMTITVHVLEGFDKRLIMFQNDNSQLSGAAAAGNYGTPEAASNSQQQYSSNSALSVHVVRLSRGRVYALFWVFIIFSTWFQLVAQVQTAISLFLLAIIGFFLGQATNGRPEGALPTRYDVDRLDSDQKKPAKTKKGSNKKKKHPSSESHSPSSTDRSAESDSSKSSMDHHLHRQEETMMMDPLIKQAHSALNLLKNFSDHGSLESINDDSMTSTMGAGKSSCNGMRSTKIRQNQQQQKSPTSPASSNSSSVSTGYNSDTRSTNLMVVSRATTNDTSVVSNTPTTCDLDTELTSLDALKVVRLRRRLGSGGSNDRRRLNEGEEGMIELISEPTAMRLIMDELTGRQQPAPISEITTAANSNTNTMSSLSVQTSASIKSPPAKPPRHQFYSTGDGMDCGNEDDDDDDEPHYSSPTLIAAHHRNLQRHRFTGAVPPEQQLPGSGCSPSPSNTCQSVG